MRIFAYRCSTVLGAACLLLVATVPSGVAQIVASHERPPEYPRERPRQYPREQPRQYPREQPRQQQRGYTVGHSYISIGGGLVVPQDTTTDNPFTNFQEVQEFDIGGAVSTAVGYESPIGFRYEFEFTYARTGLGTFGGSDGGVPFSGDGSDVGIDIYTYFFNAYFGITPPDAILAPWVGGGIGVARVVQESGIIFDNGSPTAIPSSADTAFAVNGQVGIGFKLSEQLILSPSYRYQWINTGDVNTDDFISHTFWLGLRFNLVPR